MLKKSSLLINLLLASAVSLSVTACKGRVPLTPSDPAPSTAPSANPNPVTPPNGDNPDNPAGEDPNKPPAGEPSTPDPGDGADIPTPEPPDPGQPKDSAQFFELMKKFGFTKTEAEITAEIQKGVALPITDWSPGVQKDKNKNLSDKFTESEKYFNPAIESLDNYLQKSMQLASKSSGVVYYLDVKYGPRSNSINLQKVDPATLEVLFYNKSGLISNYTQTDGKLLKLANFMLIPKELYASSGNDTAASSYYNRNPYYQPRTNTYQNKW